MTDANPSAEDREASRTVDFTNRVGAWLRTAGVTDPEILADLAVGFASMLSEARRTERSLEQMLTLDPHSPEGADAACSHLCYIQALLFTGAKGHLEDLEARWDYLYDHLASRAPDDDDGDELE